MKRLLIINVILVIMVLTGCSKKQPEAESSEIMVSNNISDTEKNKKAEDKKENMLIKDEWIEGRDEDDPYFSEDDGVIDDETDIERRVTIDSYGDLFNVLPLSVYSCISDLANQFVVNSNITDIYGFLNAEDIKTKEMDKYTEYEIEFKLRSESAPDKYILVNLKPNRRDRPVSFKYADIFTTINNEFDFTEVEESRNPNNPKIDITNIESLPYEAIDINGYADLPYIFGKWFTEHEPDHTVNTAKIDIKTVNSYYDSISCIFYPDGDTQKSYGFIYDMKYKMYYIAPIDLQSYNIDFDYMENKIEIDEFKSIFCIKAQNRIPEAKNFKLSPYKNAGDINSNEINMILIDDYPEDPDKHTTAIHCKYVLDEDCWMFRFRDYQDYMRDVKGVDHAAISDDHKQEDDVEITITDISNGEQLTQDNGESQSNADITVTEVED